ncbi:MAG: hypothetical protein H6677_27950 [Candidatus Obscuribacterales bacterium]|nr:hypothetical protein [Candidatus Obscuribacterales bacterium]
MKNKWWLKNELALVLTGIILLEFFCFLPVLRHVGFYLDDWVMLNYLSTGPDNLIDLLQFYFAVDPRVVNRPLEAIHFLGMFKFFGIKPFGYHVFNACTEIVTAWLLYLSLKLLSGNRRFSFLTCALFLLYPSHNITHYWVVSSSVTLSLVLYLGSLICDLKGSAYQRLSLHISSAFLYFLSLINYEVCLPLAALNIGLSFLIAQKQGTWKQAALYSLRPAILLSLSVVALYFYLKVLMPLLGTAWMHAVTFDSGLMLSTISEGIRLNLPWVAFEYFLEHSISFVRSEFGTTQLLLLVGQIFTMTCVYAALSRLDETKSNHESEKDAMSRFRLSAPVLILAGGLTVACSYTIFGLNDEYMPTFNTFINRVNAGATVGLSLVVLGLAIAINQFVKTKNSIFIFRQIVPIAGAILVCFYTTTNWSLARSFVISWQLQAHIFKFLIANRNQFQSASSVLLANAPRYANEAPVFDGVWDFQSMLRIALKRENVNGGVVCDRLKICEIDLKDRSKGGFLCATYPFENLYILISPTCEVVKVQDARQFINLIDNRCMQFELNKELPAIWRKQMDTPDSQTR